MMMMTGYNCFSSLRSSYNTTKYYEHFVTHPFKGGRTHSHTTIIKYCVFDEYVLEPHLRLDP